MMINPFNLKNNPFELITDIVIEIESNQKIHLVEMSPILEE